MRKALAKSAKPLSDTFYARLFPEAKERFARVSASLGTDSEFGDLVDRALASRGEVGLGADESALLLTLARVRPVRELRDRVIAEARRLRRKIFGGRYVPMVPIEVTSYCASHCVFCGWKSGNAEIPRLALSLEGLVSEIEGLAATGFAHFELSGGDDLVFLRNQLYEFVAAAKAAVRRCSPGSRLSVCFTPLLESHYARLESLGLDTVLTWQETYDESLYRAMVKSGPKAHGIDESFSVVPDGNGFLARARSQELAVRAGLQVGLGVMLGLSPDAEADVLSVLGHGRGLIETYRGAILPLIIGMPIWNPIPTREHDERSRRPTGLDVVAEFELIAAIYLLGLPDGYGWVFPNCRVPRDVQAGAVETAGCFTSTSVRLAPGSYGAADLDPRRVFARSTVPLEGLTKEKLLQGEQFVHTYHADFEYRAALRRRDLCPSTDEELLSIFRRRSGEERGEETTLCPETSALHC